MKAFIKNRVFLILVVITSLVAVLSIGYSAFGTEANISGPVARVEVDANTRITGINVDSSTDNGLSKYEEYNITNIATRVSLPEESSTVKYKVTVTNYGNVETGILKISGLPSNLEYSLEGYTLGNKICNSSNKCTLGASRDFYITFKYKADNYNSSTTEFDLNLTFDFRQFHNITYTNISGSNLPTQIIDGAKLSVSLTDSTPVGLVTTMNSKTLTMGTDYSYNRSSYALSIPAVTGDVNINKLIKLSDIITNLYTTTSKKTVTNNSITYNYASSVNLMNDRKGGTTSNYDAGNIRYYGNSPKNYIFYNCDNYNNQTTSTCEKWRIIGLFKGVTLSDGTTADLVKIVRSTGIGAYSWDASNINDWTASDVKRLINPGYSGTSGSLYYNSKSGSCYNGVDSASVSCDFTSKGLASADYNYIAQVVWPIAAYSVAETYSNVIYKNERGSGVSATGRATTWKGRVGLMSPSDYGYSTDFTTCSENLNNYDVDVDCHEKNWLYYGKAEWLINPSKDYTTSAWYINAAGYVGSYYNVRQAYQIRPVIYLKANVLSKDGTGTSSDPFHISL